MNATASLLPALLCHGQGEPPAGAVAAGGTSWAWPQAPGEVTHRADGGPCEGRLRGHPWAPYSGGAAGAWAGLLTWEPSSLT